MIRKFADKMRNGSYESCLFYRGLRVIIIVYIVVIILLLFNLERLRVIQENGDMALEYINWRYADDWKILENATMTYEVEYEPISGEDFTRYTLEIEENGNCYRIECLNGSAHYVGWSKVTEIGTISHPMKQSGDPYYQIEIDINEPFYDEVRYIWIEAKSQGRMGFGMDEFDVIAENTTVCADAEKLLGVFHEKLNKMSNYHRSFIWPFAKLTIITMLVTYIWYFLIPPNEKFQKDDTLRKIRCTMFGVLISFVGVCFGIIGGIVAAFLMDWIEKRLVTSDMGFRTRVIALTILVNVLFWSWLMNLSRNILGTIIHNIGGSNTLIIIRLVLGGTILCIVLSKLNKIKDKTEET